MNSHERSDKLNIANLKVNELAKHKSQAPWEPIVRTCKYYESEKWREKLDILRILDILPYWLINAKWPTLFFIYMILFETKDSDSLRCAINQPLSSEIPCKCFTNYSSSSFRYDIMHIYSLSQRHCNIQRLCWR